MNGHGQGLSPVTAEKLAWYVGCRVRVLRSLDEVTIRAWLAAYGMRWPVGPAFWARVHRHRHWPLSGLDDAKRAESRRWLDERSMELGELFWDEERGLELERKLARIR